MIYNFTVTMKGAATEYGLVTADSIEEAERFVLEGFPRDECEDFDIQPGAEDLINQQYGGLALLTSGL